MAIDSINSIKTIDIEALVMQARKGPEPPVPVYEFGAGRKKFLDIYNPPSTYDKPADHSPDPYFDGPGQW